jgi:lambda family phage portal protein
MLEVKAGMGIPFEGAEQFNRQMASWLPTQRSADADLLPHKYLLDARTLDSSRNDSYIDGAIDFHKDNIVGTSYNLVAKPNYAVLGKTEEWAEQFAEEVEAKFTLWAESRRNWVDASAHNNFSKLLRLCVAQYLLHGEILATVEYRRKGLNRPYGTCIQMIDPARLSNPPGLIENRLAVGGIEKNKYGEAIAYNIRRTHPIEYGTYQYTPLDYRRIPAKKEWGRPMVIHIFEQDRVDQSRGVTTMVSLLKELNVTKKFREIVLQNAVVQATFAAVVETEVPVGEEIYTALGAGKKSKASEDSYSEAFNQIYGSYLGGVADWVKSNPNAHRINGSQVPVMFPGTKLKMLAPTQGGPLGTDFEASLLRYIAAGLGISYEQLSKDYTNTNYSSARAAMNETWKSLQAKKHFIVDHMASEIYALWLEEAIMSDQIESLPSSEMPLSKFYSGLNREALSAGWFIGGARGQIDELKETQAAQLRLLSGVTTLEKECRVQGLDYRETIKQRAREQKMLEAAGLLPDPESSDMMNSVKGKASQVEAPEPENQDEE